MGKKSVIQKKVEAELASLQTELHDYALTITEVEEEMKTIEAKMDMLTSLLEAEKGEDDDKG